MERRLSRPGTGPPPWHRSSPLTVPPLRNLPPNAIALASPHPPAVALVGGGATEPNTALPI